MLITFRGIDSNCSFTGGTNGTIPICAEVLLDINGLNGPNIRGKDIQGFWIQAYGIQPHGAQGDLSTSCTETGGSGCSAVYLYK